MRKFSFPRMHDPDHDFCIRSILHRHKHHLIFCFYHVGEGDVFGDDVCRFNDIGRSVADVFALTYANVHAIGRDELLSALAFYPEYGIQFAKVFRLSYSLRDEVCLFVYLIQPI